MEYRTFGKTGLKVSVLGVGLSEVGFGLDLEQAELASRVLNVALDHGINLLDTAACYGIAEELIGRYVSHRRGDFLLSTKCGHVPAGESGDVWTAATITRDIERSLRLMRTDYLDIVHLHSCTVEVLAQGEVIEALEQAKRDGKTRFIAYSGDNEAAAWAVESGRFDGLQTSANLVDQRARKRILPAAAKAQMRVIAKRPIANGAWKAERSPSEYAAQYHKRGAAMLAAGPLERDWPDPVETALAYVLALPGVTTAIVGTKNPAHMIENIHHLASVPDVPSELVGELNRRFDAVGSDWVQLT